MLLPTGVRFESFATEGRYIHTWPQAMWFAALLLALVLIPHAVSLYTTGVLTVMFITLIAVYGLQVTVGMAGQINVAQSAFMGVGAYAAARLSSLFGLRYRRAGLPQRLSPSCSRCRRSG